MADTIAILGANGVYARHLIPRLVATGYPVRAVVRRPEAAGFARACGAEIRIADIFDTNSMIAAFEGCSAAINLATTLPGPRVAAILPQMTGCASKECRTLSRPAAKRA